MVPRENVYIIASNHIGTTITVSVDCNLRIQFAIKWHTNVYCKVIHMKTLTLAV